jgi:mannonate dehydratase
MTDNRRDFLKKSASIAAALSVGSLNTAISKPLLQNDVANSELNSLAKDAGMEMSNAYFSGMEANKQLIELAKQMGAFGAIAGIDMRLTKSANANPWDYNAIMEVRESWKKVGLNYNTVEGPPSLGEKTKLGLEGRDEEISNFITFMKNLKRSGVDIICYNWTPVVSWARTQMDRP